VLFVEREIADEEDAPSGDSRSKSNKSLLSLLLLLLLLLLLFDMLLLLLLFEEKEEFELRLLLKNDGVEDDVDIDDVVVGGVGCKTSETGKSNNDAPALFVVELFALLGAMLLPLLFINDSESKSLNKSSIFVKTQQQ
jgi:hypothetical protein